MSIEYTLRKFPVAGALPPPPPPPTMMSSILLQQRKHKSRLRENPGPVQAILKTIVGCRSHALCSPLRKSFRRHWTVPARRKRPKLHAATSALRASGSGLPALLSACSICLQQSLPALLGCVLDPDRPLSLRRYINKYCQFERGGWVCALCNCYNDYTSIVHRK